MDASGPSIGQTAKIVALRSCRIFESINSSDLEQIAEFSALLRLSKGQALFSEGEPTRGFFLVRSGAINVHRIAPDGREKSIHIFRAGETLAEATVADGGSYPANARAEGPSVVLFIPGADFLSLLQQRPGLSLKMLSSLSHHLRILVNAIDNLGRRDMDMRLSQWLLHRCPVPLTNDPCDIRLDVSKATLAAELGVRQETLSRALQRLTALGHIESRRNAVRVVDPLRFQQDYVLPTAHAKLPIEA